MLLLDSNYGVKCTDKTRVSLFKYQQMFLTNVQGIELASK